MASMKWQMHISGALAPRNSPAIRPANLPRCDIDERQVTDSGVGARTHENGTWNVAPIRTKTATATAGSISSDWPTAPLHTCARRADLDVSRVQ